MLYMKERRENSVKLPYPAAMLCITELQLAFPGLYNQFLLF